MFTRVCWQAFYQVSAFLLQMFYPNNACLAYLEDLCMPRFCNLCEYKNGILILQVGGENHCFKFNGTDFSK